MSFFGLVMAFEFRIPDVPRLEERHEALTDSHEELQNTVSDIAQTLLDSSCTIFGGTVNGIYGNNVNTPVPDPKNTSICGVLTFKKDADETNGQSYTLQFDGTIAIDTRHITDTNGSGPSGSQSSGTCFVLSLNFEDFVDSVNTLTLCELPTNVRYINVLKLSASGLTSELIVGYNAAYPITEGGLSTNDTSPNPLHAFARLGLFNPTNAHASLPEILYLQFNMIVQVFLSKPS